MKFFSAIFALASAVLAVQAAAPPAISKVFTMNVNLVNSLPPIPTVGGMKIGMFAHELFTRVTSEL
jgi:hypothetical protein